MSKGGVVGSRRRFLAIAVALGLAAAVSACKGGSGSTSAATPAAASASPSAGPASAAPSSPAAQGSPSAAAPGGYHRIGGATQGISIEVPGAYTVIDTSSLAAADASLKKLRLGNESGTTISQQVQKFIKLHGVMAMDGQSIVTNPGHFANNINAYCVDSGTVLTGTVLVPELKHTLQTQYEQQLGAQGVTVSDTKLGGIAGAEVRYELPRSAGTTVAGGQVVAAVKPHKACFVTLSAPKGGFPGEILSSAAASAQFP
ncbi:MAG: hypothetical protein ACM3NS_10035 [Deltaproteobacteria bacterium]